MDSLDLHNLDVDSDTGSSLKSICVIPTVCTTCTHIMLSLLSVNALHLTCFHHYVIIYREDCCWQSLSFWHVYLSTLSFFLQWCKQKRCRGVQGKEYGRRIRSQDEVTFYSVARYVLNDEYAIICTKNISRTVVRKGPVLCVVKAIVMLFYTMHTYKVSWTPHDDKLYILDNGRDTYAYGYHKTRRVPLNDDGETHPRLLNRTVYFNVGI